MEFGYEVTSDANIEEFLAVPGALHDRPNTFRSQMFSSSNETCNGAGILTGVMFYIARRLSEGSGSLGIKAAQCVVSVTNQCKRTLGSYDSVIPSPQLLDSLYQDLNERDELFGPVIPALLKRSTDKYLPIFTRVLIRSILTYLENVGLDSYIEIHKALKTLSRLKGLNSSVLEFEVEHAHKIDKVYMSVPIALRPFMVLMDSEKVLNSDATQHVPTIRAFGSFVLATVTNNWGNTTRRAHALTNSQQSTLNLLISWFGSSSIYSGETDLKTKNG